MPSFGMGEATIWYTNPATKKSQPVPRHSEIHEGLAKSIIRKLSKENEK
jgi:hypothetical protein